MDISILFLSLYIGLLIYLANQSEIERRVNGDSESHRYQQRAIIVRWMLFGAIGMKFVYSLIILQWAYLSSTTDALKGLDVNLPPVDPTIALVNFGLMLVIGFLALRVVLSNPTRQFIRRLVGGSSLYNPDSTVHVAAVVLLLCFISFIFDQLVASGGLSGLAQEVSDNGVSLVAVVLQDALLIIGAFLGVGMAIRRDLPQSLERLGLRIPTLQDFIWGVGAGLLLFGATIIMAQIWSLVVPPDQFQQQNAASDQLAKAFNTLPSAFLLASFAAVSEEILFRGALQPVFGLPLASIIFALSHVQYALTPAALIILIVGLGLGILRRRRNTTTAIIAHFVYDFVQLAIQILVVQAVGGV